MTGTSLSLFTRYALLATGIGVCFASAGTSESKQRDSRFPVFIQSPQRIHYYVTRNQSANLTWVAKNVCKIQIKCNGKKFQDGLTRVCGKSCQRCKTRTKTKIVTVHDFPQDERSFTCQCKVWGKIAVRSDKIIIEKSFLRRNFGTVQSCHVVSPNTTVVLQCKAPYGTPRPNITWYKMGKPLLLGRRVRLRSKRDLVIKRVKMTDSGEYHCVARNLAAKRMGPVMKLDVRAENISTLAVFNASSCASQQEPDCKSQTNSSTCADSQPPPTLIFGTQDGLYTTDLFNTSKKRRVEANNIVSLDYGLIPNRIYWSDGKSINRFNMYNGVSKDMPFRYDDVNSVEGLAVDWTMDKVYWTDTVHDGIYIGDLQNGKKVKIIDKNLDSPRAIVVSHSEGHIYWTDWGRTPKIERARLDGTERKVLINNGIQFPNGLALDEPEKTLYWAGTDANDYGIIEAVSLDGLNRTVIFYSSGYHPFSLDIYQDFIYWSDWQKRAVLRVNKTDGGGVEAIVNGLNKPMGIKILHRRKEKKVINQCEKDNGECEHLCLYLPFLERKRCFCEDKFKLGENEKTCNRIELQEELANKSKSSPNSPTDPSLVVILLVFILLLVVLGLVIFLIKKRCPCHVTEDKPRMTRQSASPVDEDDVGDESLELTDQTDLGRTVQHVNSEPAETSNLIGQESSEPSGSAAAACEDALVAPTSPRNLVVYVTKVEVEQHGGVTVVGDDAKVHHHYTPQS